MLLSARVRTTIATFALVGSVLPTLVAQPAQAVTTATSGVTVTNTFTYTGATETMTVPANVTELTVTITGAEGGRGGNDSSGRPPAGGYTGRVTGTISVTPGDVLTIAVGGGGVDSDLANGGAGGVAAESGDSHDALGGANPLGGYAGGNGGSPGPAGSSGYGGSGGAASVLKIGTATIPDAVGTVIAGGSGGSGGSGQYVPLIGRISLSSHSPRTDAVSTSGQNGKYVYSSCLEAGAAALGWCDGGGGAGGGGGAVGGARGLVEFGSGSATEWFGHGGNPGANATGGFTGLAAGYVYYPGNNGGGSVVIRYSSGLPGQPTGVTPSAGNGSASVYWTAPSVVGESALTGYVVEYAVGPNYDTWTTVTTCTGLTTSCTVSGLTNDVGVKFRVSASNSTGTGNPSPVTAAVTPAGPPGQPTIDGITAGDASLSVAFTAPASSGTITDYQYRLNAAGNWISTGRTASPLTISGLLNGTVYGVEIRAVSAGGTGTASTSTNGTPSALPGAPTITAVTAGQDGTSLIVTFAGGFTGGSAITDYEYATSVGENTSSFGSYASAGTASPFTITGLTSGTTYTVQLRAKNAAGSGPGSAYRTGVTLAAPQAPVLGAITVADGRLTVAYTAYTDSTNGGSPISRMEYSTDGGTTWANAGTLANPFTISGLTNGTQYAIALRAVNPIGTSQASTSSNATPAGVPSSPRQVAAVGGQQAATVSWLAPSSNNGAPVTSYTVTAYDAATGGNVAGTCSTAGLSCSVPSLSNGTAYHFEVKATNSAGTGLPSAPRVSATPAALPGAPTMGAVTTGNAYISVAFTAGTADVNAPVTAYQYTLNNGTNWVTASSTSSPIFISGLTNGTQYNVKVRAVSDVGVSPASAAGTGTPFTLPDAVVASTITYAASAGSVIVSWSAANANGSAVTNYTVAAFSALIGGSIIRTCSTSTTSCTIDGLSNGTTYYVSIEAQNVAGYSPRSAPRVAVRPGTATTTSLVSSAASGTVGTSLTLTATVAPADATGTVNFTSGNTSITGCSAVAVTNGVAVCTTTSLGAGANAIRANYSGDNVYSSSASADVTVTVSALTQAITFAALANREVADGAFTVSATGGASANPVTFTSLTTTICTATGTNGATITPRAPGTCIIRANQVGNANYGAATAVERSFAVAERYTVSYDVRGGNETITAQTHLAGETELVLPAVTRQSYVLDGWYDAATGGTRVGRAGANYTPAATGTLYARWVQASLWGMGASTRIGSITTTNGVGNAYRASSGNSSIDLSYPADALPAGTVVDVYLQTDSTRARELITDPTALIASVIVAWKATDETVPNTAQGKPLTMTLTDPDIRIGHKIYSIVGDTVTLLGTATQNGSVVVELTEDPEIVIAATVAGAPTNVTAVAGERSAQISWTAPATDGGTPITGYAVFAGATQVCTTATTSCTATGLTGGQSYTFTVRTVNAAGQGAASAPSAAVIPTGASAAVSGGGASGGAMSGGGNGNTGSGSSQPAKVTPMPPANGPVRSKPTMIVGGIQRDVVVAPRANGGLSYSAGDVGVIVVPPTVYTPVDAPIANVIVARPGDEVEVSGEGFAGNGDIQALLFSEPILLATLKADANGSFSGKVRLPAGVSLGDHTLQLAALDPKGEALAVSVGVQLLGATQLAPATGSKRVLVAFKAGSTVLTAAAAKTLRRTVASLARVTITAVAVTGVAKKAKSRLVAAKDQRARAAAVAKALRAAVRGVVPTTSYATASTLGGTDRVLVTLTWKR